MYSSSAWNFLRSRRAIDDFGSVGGVVASTKASEIPGVVLEAMIVVAVGAVLCGGGGGGVVIVSVAMSGNSKSGSSFGKIRDTGGCFANNCKNSCLFAMVVPLGQAIPTVFTSPVTLLFAHDHKVWYTFCLAECATPGAV